MQVLDVKWFCGLTNVGIVMTDDPWDGIKYYISAVSGNDEESDKQYIASWGSTFPESAGDILFGVKR